MKITAKQYARSLFEEIKDLEEAKEQNKIIRNFASVLVKNNHVSYLPQILRKFKQIWNQEKGIVEAEVISARELNKEAQKEIEKFIQSKNGKKSIETNYEINSEIKGGFVVKMEDKILDASLKSRIWDLRNILVE